jgi:hypothetical protein
MSAWKPIKTAPRDRQILIRNPRWMFNTCYIAYSNGIRWFDVSDDAELNGPTEWTEIPE